MSIQVFAETIGDYELCIRYTIREMGKPPRAARMDAWDYGKACYYSRISCRVYDRETRVPINDKVYGIPYDERTKMTNNEYVLKVLFSCRTLGQLEACKDWAKKTSGTISTNLAIVTMALWLKR